MPFSNYNELVDQRIESGSSEVFGNFSVENAKYIIPRFIASAQKSIAILSGSISDGLYGTIDGNIRSEVMRALEKASEQIAQHEPQNQIPPVRIVALDGKPNSDLLRLVSSINERYGFLVIKPAYATLAPNFNINHFLVVDGKMYRLEEIHKPFGSTLPVAIKAEVCCNGPEKAGKLLEVFNKIWNKIAG